MYRGKVWHLAIGADPEALCGQVRDWASDESTSATAPMNARVCEACGSASEDIAEAVRLARQGDPRQPLPIG